jgi:Ca2+-binding EF-hand superfamily protein
MPLNLTKKEMNAAMLTADSDGDGKISFQEFLPVFHSVIYKKQKMMI